jgi:manganese/zinc/iron transport system ATP- binding protein
MTGRPLLTLDHLTAGHGRQPVLVNVHLVLARGTLAGLIGANGSGKTTLLKTIAGILPPLDGTVKFHPLDGRPPVLGYVPQRESLDPIYPLSSFEVTLMGTYARVSPGRWAQREERDWARECLRQTGAEDIAERRFAELSGGQKQRVLIARALAARPDLLLLDEPTAGIDAAASRAIAALLRRLHEQGMTILMVNHELPVVREIASEVIWLQNGQAEQGTAEQMLSPQKMEQLFELRF